MHVLEYNRLLARAIWVPLAVLAMVSVALALKLHWLLAAAEQAQHTEATIGDLALVERLAIDLETGLRGYVATGEALFLEPYLVAGPQLRTELERIHREEREEGDAVQVASLEALKTQLEFWQRHEEVVLEPAFRDLSASEVRDRELEGKRRMDAVRGTLTTLREHETNQLSLDGATKTELAESTWWLGLMALLAVGLTMSLIVRRQIAVLQRTYSDALAQLTSQASALRVREQEALEQRDRIVDLQRKKQDLISFMMHDLRNPLAVIQSDSHFVAQQPELEPETREAIADVETATSRMLRMSLDMLDVMGGTAALKVHSAPLAMAPLISELARTYDRRGRELGLRVSIGALEDASQCVGDPTLIRRVLENFVENALKYTPRGGDIFIELHAASSEGRAGVVVRVRDTGPGIPPEQRGRVFESGIRLDRDAEVHRSSRGLGLAFCRLAAEAHGGRVWVEEGVPQGSAFCLELPANRAESLPLDRAEQLMGALQMA